MSLKDCLLGTAVVTGGTALYAGVAAGFGAASGAIGWSILRAAGWKSVSFGYTELVSANALGSALLSFFPGLCSMACLQGAVEKERAAGVATGTLISYSLTGALASMLGSVILGYLQEGVQVGFAAAAGATGSLVLGAGLATVGCIVACCGGLTYLCCRGNSGEVVMAKVPSKDLNQDGTIKTGAQFAIEDLEKVDAKKVLPDAANWDKFAHIVSKRLAANGEQPLEQKEEAPEVLALRIA